ncbi:uncharacterized protein LOC100198420 isoform X1 [Hydra vulgaris]|uniref:uncharacterized protein LOC100198420 isoform X1 n=1 Tax=Hydra vulgaris TaxID=6087 RepID=UPI00064100C9|nr:GTPase-activating protein [Hydra vulgaris]
MPALIADLNMECLSAQHLLSLPNEKKKQHKNTIQLFENMQQQLQILKVDICKQCKKNFELEKEVRFFDQRIALLINHKITVDEFPDNISYGEHRLGALKDDLKNRIFGNLFFLLQTDPRYLAKLTRSVAPTEIDELLQIVLFSLYGNQYEAREEHLLLKMFELAIKMEFDETDEFGSLMRANTAISRMMTTYTRRGPGQEYLKETLQDIVVDVNSNIDLNLEVNPVKVYTAIYQIIDNEQNNITMERALRDPKVAKVIKYRLKGLEDITEQFFEAIVASLDYVPYGIRWLCKAIYQLCRERFPHIPIEQIAGLIGGFFLLRFINPAIVSPHNYMLLNSQPRPAMRRNFILIAKLLQAISNKGASQVLKEVYMKPLQYFVTSRQEKLQKFLHNLCDVDDFHSYLEIEQYLSLPKDMSISITLKEMHRLHELLCKYQDFLINDDNDNLTVLLHELGEPMSSECLDDVTVDVALLSRWDVSLSFRDEMIDPDGAIDNGIKNLRKQCRTLLIKLLTKAPYLMKELNMRDVISRGLATDNEEVIRLASFAMTCLSELQDNDKLYCEEDLLRSVKEFVLKQEHHSDRMLRELKGLKNVKESLEWHGEFLTQQLDAYKEYLSAVRNKAAHRDGEITNGNKGKLNLGPLEFSFTQLEKEGVILESRSISAKRKQNINFIVLCTEPGIYRITLRYKTPIAGQPAVMDMDLHLEELLEYQHFRDPVLNLNEFVVLDVRHTLSFLHKHFRPKKL